MRVPRPAVSVRVTSPRPHPGDRPGCCARRSTVVIGSGSPGHNPGRMGRSERGTPGRKGTSLDALRLRLQMVASEKNNRSVSTEWQDGAARAASMAREGIHALAASSSDLQRVAVGEMDPVSFSSSEVARAQERSHGRDLVDPPVDEKHPTMHLMGNHQCTCAVPRSWFRVWRRSGRVLSWVGSHGWLRMACGMMASIFRIVGGSLPKTIENRAFAATLPP